MEFDRQPVVGRGYIATSIVSLVLRVEFETERCCFDDVLDADINILVEEGEFPRSFDSRDVVEEGDDWISTPILRHTI
jgi:hypothetical protein